MMRTSPHGKKELLSIFLGTLLLTVLCLYYVPYLAPLPVLVLLFSLYFFRDPERDIPEKEGLIVSPADGKVVDIEEVDENDYLGEPAIRIGIFLSVFNVHVNRAPIAGTVRYTNYREGAFHNAAAAEASEENESNTLGIEGTHVRVTVKQIAGLIARRIVCTASEGTRVNRGERFGMIKFGSRTELYVPSRTQPEIAVEVGDHVKGGESLLAQLPDRTIQNDEPVESHEQRQT